MLAFLGVAPQPGQTTLPKVRAQPPRLFAFAGWAHGDVLRHARRVAAIDARRVRQGRAPDNQVTRCGTDAPRAQGQQVLLAGVGPFWQLIEPCLQALVEPRHADKGPLFGWRVVQIEHALHAKRQRTLIQGRVPVQIVLGRIFRVPVRVMLGRIFV